MVPPHRHQPNGSVEPRPRARVALHHYTHLAPPQPGRGRHPLQHVGNRQNRQARAPLLSAPPLLPHTGAPNTNPHMPRPKPRHSLHPSLHLLLPHTRTAGKGAHSHVPPSETHHLQRNRSVRHPRLAADNPSGPPHHRPRHIRLPAHEPMPPPATVTGGRFFFTDASGESALTPITGGATLQLTLTGGHYHMDHHTDHTTYGASSHGELGAMADAIAEIAAHLPAHLRHIVRVWFMVDATVDTHLLFRKARQPLHKATATSLGTQALLLWKALCSLPPYVQLHIVKQESHRHQYGNGKVDNQAVHQRTCQPSRSLTSAETTHTSNTYPPYPSPIRPRTGFQRTPPIPPTTGHTTTPTPSNISPACSATQTAGHTSRSSRRRCKSPSTTQHCAQQTSQPTSKNDASSSSGSNYHSSPGSPDGWPANTSTSPKNTSIARATTPPRRTENTSRNAPSMQAGTR